MSGEREISIEGIADDPDAPVVANYRAISARYLETLQIPLRGGRAFRAADREGAQLVSILSESFVRKYLFTGSPLGRRIRIGRNGDHWTTVVGVTADTIDDWLFARNVPTVFVPNAQFPSADMTLVARTPGDPDQLADGLRRALGAVDPTLPAFGAMSLRDVVKVRTTGLRFVAGLMAAFGAVGLALSCLGIYGVIAHFVALRRRELGLRIALGASARDILALTVRQGARLTAVGIVLGLGGAAALGRVIESALFGIVTLDWPLVLAIAVLLGLAALLATLVPAWRALQLDPAAMLKE